VIRAHEFNRDAAAAACDALEHGRDEEAILRGLFAIADRLAEISELFAATSDALPRDGRPFAPRAAEAVAEERYGARR
jgi:hypothetical protein